MQAKLAQKIREEKLRKKQMAKVQRRRHLAPSSRKTDNQGVKVGELCALCGVNQASTRDHVPPKAIFPKPRPPLITVPACFECNNSASDLDDLFKVYLSMHAAENNEIARQLLLRKLSELCDEIKICCSEYTKNRGVFPFEISRVN